MYRSEYPRPEFKREEWLSLNGQWDFCFPGEEMRKIEVPFVFQSEMSGIHENRMCDSCLLYTSGTRCVLQPSAPGFQEKLLFLKSVPADKQAQMRWGAVLRLI